MTQRCGIDFEAKPTGSIHELLEEFMKETLAEADVVAFYNPIQPLSIDAKKP